MTKPLWENEQWLIYEHGLFGLPGVGGIYIPRHELENAPIKIFKTEGLYHDFDEDLQYEAFLQLATYWGLECDYDELRKIRDEMKEKAE